MWLLKPFILIGSCFFNKMLSEIFGEYFLLQD